MAAAEEIPAVAKGCPNQVAATELAGGEDPAQVVKELMGQEDLAQVETVAGGEDSAQDPAPVEMVLDVAGRSRVGCEFRVPLPEKIDLDLEMMGIPEMMEGPEHSE